MTFKSTPHHAIMDKNHEFWFKFDENGIFDLNAFMEEQKAKMIDKLKLHFEEYKEESEVVEAPTDTKVITCSVCGDTFDNRGKFMQHSKTHKSEG